MSASDARRSALQSSLTCVHAILGLIVGLQVQAANDYRNTAMYCIWRLAKYSRGARLCPPAAIVGISVMYTVEVN